MNKTYHESRFIMPLLEMLDDMQKSIDAIPEADLEKYKGLAVHAVECSHIQRVLEQSGNYKHMKRADDCIEDIAHLFHVIGLWRTGDSTIIEVNSEIRARLAKNDYLERLIGEDVFENLEEYIHLGATGLYLSDGVSQIEGAYISTLDSDIEITFVTKNDQINYSVLTDPSDVIISEKSFSLLMIEEESESLRQSMNHCLDDVKEGDEFKHIKEQGWLNIVEKALNLVIGATLIFDGSSSAFDDFNCGYSTGFPEELLGSIKAMEEITYQESVSDQDMDDAAQAIVDYLEEARLLGHYQIFSLDDVPFELDKNYPVSDEFNEEG